VGEPKTFKKKPAYFYSPSILWKSCKYRFLNRLGLNLVCYDLPWGNKIDLSLTEGVGRAIAFSGVYELAMMELLNRILRTGDCAVDVGANIGYVSSLMAKRLGPSGKVFAFEPEPTLIKKFKSNISLWDKNKNSDIRVVEGALSSRSGKMTLFLPDGWETNEGLGTFSSDRVNKFLRTVEVDAFTLDEFFNSETLRIDLLKIDVEGHELEVLKGARGLLSRGQIRNIIFEENRNWVVEHLIKLGYSVFFIEKSFSGLSLEPVTTWVNSPNWEPNNYFATIQSTAEIQKWRAPGWTVLRRQ